MLYFRQMFSCFHIFCRLFIQKLPLKFKYEPKRCDVQPSSNEGTHMCACTLNLNMQGACMQCKKGWNLPFAFHRTLNSRLGW